MCAGLLITAIIRIKGRLLLSVWRRLVSWVTRSSRWVRAGWVAWLWLGWVAWLWLTWIARLGLGYWVAWLSWISWLWLNERLTLGWVSLVNRRLLLRRWNSHGYLSNLSLEDLSSLPSLGAETEWAATATDDAYQDQHHNDGKQCAQDLGEIFNYLFKIFFRDWARAASFYIISTAKNVVVRISKTWAVKCCVKTK